MNGMLASALSAAVFLVVALLIIHLTPESRGRKG
jgi:hypothetical protein